MATAVIPEHGYEVSGLYLALEACERFGILPFGRRRWDGHTEDERAVLIAYGRIRRSEEQARRSAWCKAMGGGGM